MTQIEPAMSVAVSKPIDGTTRLNEIGQNLQMIPTLFLDRCFGVPHRNNLRPFVVAGNTGNSTSLKDRRYSSETQQTSDTRSEGKDVSLMADGRQPQSPNPDAVGLWLTPGGKNSCTADRPRTGSVTTPQSFAGRRPARHESQQPLTGTSYFPCHRWPESAQRIVCFS